jgi:hypothetical protein
MIVSSYNLIRKHYLGNIQLKFDPITESFPCQSFPCEAPIFGGLFFLTYNPLFYILNPPKTELLSFFKFLNRGIDLGRKDYLCRPV